MADVLVVGAGAMGSAIGALLAKSGNEVTLLDVDEARMTGSGASDPG